MRVVQPHVDRLGVEPSILFRLSCMGDHRLLTVTMPSQKRLGMHELVVGAEDDDHERLEAEHFLEPLSAPFGSS
jgi:hypothetical protein